MSDAIVRNGANVLNEEMFSKRGRIPPGDRGGRASIDTFQYIHILRACC